MFTITMMLCPVVLAGLLYCVSKVFHRPSSTNSVKQCSNALRGTSGIDEDRKNAQNRVSKCAACVLVVRWLCFGMLYNLYDAILKTRYSTAGQ